AALKAVELDPLLPEAHASLAVVKIHHDWDWSGGEAEFKQALRLNPNYETAYRWYGNFLDAMGRYAEAIAAAKRAQELDPTSLLNSSSLGAEFYRARRYDEAQTISRRTFSLRSPTAKSPCMNKPFKKPRNQWFSQITAPLQWES